MLRIALILLTVLAVSACGSEKKHCWGCVLLFSDGYVTSYRDSAICDKTQSEINNIKKIPFDATSMGYETYQIDHCSKIRK